MTPALLTFVLYWIAWIPGLIANVYYNGEAKAAEKVAGRSLPGVGCLQTQFILFTMIPLVLMGVAVIGFLACSALGLLGIGIGAVSGSR